MSVNHNPILIFLFCVLLVACDTAQTMTSLIRPPTMRQQKNHQVSHDTFSPILAAMKKQGIVVLSGHSRQRFVLPTDKIFYRKSAKFRQHAEAPLLALLAMLKSQPSQSIRIAGFTDGKPNINYTQILSQQRANRLKQFLVQHGVQAEKILSIGYGEQTPLASNLTNKGRYLNRRIEVTVLG